MTSLYPDALHRTYIVPPVHFNRVPYETVTVPGTGLSALMLDDLTATPAHKVPPLSQPSGAAPFHGVPPHSLWIQEPHPQSTPRRVQESDCNADFAQRCVLTNLRELGNDGCEVMFILSQLEFASYLNKPSFAAAAAQLPRPINLAPRYRHGNFGILLIHRLYGILIGKIKAINCKQATLSLPQGRADVNVVKRVRKTVSHLDKSDTVITYLLSDIAPGLTIKKTIFLPFVSSSQLHRVLSADPQLEQVIILMT